MILSFDELRNEQLQFYHEFHFTHHVLRVA